MGKFLDKAEKLSMDSIEGARKDLLVKHLTKEEREEDSRETNARAHARDLKQANHRFHPQLGAPIATMDLTDFVRLHMKYGDEIFQDDFLKFFQREYPELSPNAV
jgi:hypothetical protein